MKRKPKPDPKQVVSEWGLPDWLDANRYPEHKAVGIDQWCWEFLRRSNEYRTFWRSEILPRQQRRAALPQKVERFVARQMDEREERALRLEILKLPSAESLPLIARLNGGQTPVSPMPEECLLDGGTRFGMNKAMQRFQMFHAVDPRKSGPPTFADSVTELEDIDQDDPYKLIVKLDVRLPDKHQLDQIKDLLRTRRLVLKKLGTLKHHVPKGGRSRTELYSNYLRVLDAKESGASYRKIARILFPDRSIDDGTKRVANFYNAACKLRDGGWRQLLPAIDEFKGPK